MTRLGRAMSLFPLLHVTLVAVSALWFVASLSLLAGLASVFFIYLFPLLCFRLHNKKFPIKHGVSDLTKGYSPWYGAHMLQYLHLTFPVFERLLRLIPGAFSLWLRLWGSKVGNNVYWTAHLTLGDRSLLEIGDNCVFGYNIKITCHAIRPNKRDGLLLYVKPVVIKNHAFIGAESRFGPGVVLQAGAQLPVCSEVLPNTVLSGRLKRDDVRRAQTSHKEQA